MILFLGLSADVGDFQPVNIPDETAVSDVLPILRGLWWGPSYDPPVPEPLWVASDSPTLAEGASDLWGGLPVYEVAADGFSVVAPA